MNKIGLSPSAAYTNSGWSNEFLAALHFLLEENSLEEVFLRIKQQYGSLQIEKKPLIFDCVQSGETLLSMDLWRQLPQEMLILASNGLFESIARCSKRQISWIGFTLGMKNHKAELYYTFGKQFSAETNFYVVEFAYSSQKLPFAVTAT